MGRVSGVERGLDSGRPQFLPRVCAMLSTYSPGPGGTLTERLGGDADGSPEADAPEEPPALPPLAPEEGEPPRNDGAPPAEAPPPALATPLAAVPPVFVPF